MSQEKHIIEALLFVSDEPLLIEQIKDVLEHLQAQDIRVLLDGLKKEYEDACRGIKIVEVAGGFQMVTNPEFSAHLKKYYKHMHAERLSAPALETLAIIAYKQPVTRLDIEAIRGVNVDGMVKSLMEKGLIRIVGRKEVIGRPFVYGTTRQFLEYFGLSSLHELPKMEEFSSLVSQSTTEGVITPIEEEINKTQSEITSVSADNCEIAENNERKE